MCHNKLQPSKVAKEWRNIPFFTRYLMNNFLSTKYLRNQMSKVYFCVLICYWKNWNLMWRHVLFSYIDGSPRFVHQGSPRFVFIGKFLVTSSSIQIVFSGNCSGEGALLWCHLVCTFDSGDVGYYGTLAGAVVRVRVYQGECAFGFGGWG